MSSRYLNPDPDTDYAISAAEEDFAQYLRNKGYRVSTQVEFYYTQFDPRKDRVLYKMHAIDIVLDDYDLPAEILGKHHLKQRQQKKDDVIFQEISDAYGSDPVLLWNLHGGQPSKRLMDKWYNKIQEEI